MIKKHVLHLMGNDGDNAIIDKFIHTIGGMKNDILGKPWTVRVEFEEGPIFSANVPHYPSQTDVQTQEESCPQSGAVGTKPESATLGIGWMSLLGLSLSYSQFHSLFRKSMNKKGDLLDEYEWNRQLPAILPDFFSRLCKTAAKEGRPLDQINEDRLYIFASHGQQTTKGQK